MKGFNLSEWAITHRPFVWFLMILFVAAGVLSYKQLGREEDPSFSIKTMIVRTYWPGATIDDTMLQVTDRIEKKLQETPSLYYLKSETKPGELMRVEFEIEFLVLRSDQLRLCGILDRQYLRADAFDIVAQLAVRKPVGRECINDAEDVAELVVEARP